MNSPDQADVDQVICDCSGTTKFKIEHLIDNGKDNLNAISRATGAASGCGSCDILIMEILAQKGK